MLSTLSVRSAKSERCDMKKDVLQLYQSEELPSIYDPKGLDSGFFDVLINKNQDQRADVVDWKGENDAANPKNWSTWKKSINIGCICLMCIISPFTSSVVAPAIPDLMRDFSSLDTYLSAFVLSIYVLGYAFGPLLISPLSELYGRVPLYHACNIMFTIFTAFCGRANSLRTLAMLRCFAGVGASSVFALAPSSLADMIAKEKRGVFMALVAMGYNLGPAVSPTAGSYINDAWGWPWIFYLTSILGAFASLLSVICLSETYEPVLLQRKAAGLRKTTGNPALRSRLDIGANKGKLGVFRHAMLMPLRMLLFSPSIFLTSLLTAIGYGLIYILYTTIPDTFLNRYAWEPKRIGLAYLGTAVGNLIGMVAGGGISDAIVKRRAAKGDTKPENRLLPMIFFWPLVSIGLFIYAWTAEYIVHWIAPLIGTAIFGAGAMSAIFFTGTYILDAYPVHSASGMAASSVLRSLIGGLAPLFSNKLYQKLGIAWAFSLLAFIALAFAPVPLIFFKFGEIWRRKERFDELAGNKGVTDSVKSERKGAESARV